MKLNDSSTDKLVDFFAEICLAQDEILRSDDKISRYNKLFDEMVSVIKELESRDAKHLLARLFVHPNVQVRLQAAIAAWPILPLEALQIMEAISEEDWMPQSPNAKEAFRRRKTGVYQPP